MPIVFVHGVSVRNPDSFTKIKTYLQQHIAPEIAPDPHNVKIFIPFWGQVGASFAWDGISRPRSALLGKGSNTTSPFEDAVASAELVNVLDKLLKSNKSSVFMDESIPAGSNLTTLTNAVQLQLQDLTPKQLSDLAATVIFSQPSNDPQQQAFMALAADDVAHTSDTFLKLAECSDREAEIELLEELIIARCEHYQQDSKLVGMGSGLQNFSEVLGEALGRISNFPGYIGSRVLTEVRKPLNDLVKNFLGDIFTYLSGRGDASDPGKIPQIVLEALHKARNNQQQRHGEPLIVISHSMGGQIVYDLVTHFLPKMPEYKNIYIDFWCATASQVGFFEELKLFLESSPNYSKSQGNLVPFPNQEHLGNWWNVWDHNDFISYSTRGIIADVDDEAYNSYMSVINAHTGYLQLPDFFRTFASKLRAAKEKMSLLSKDNI